MRASEPTVFPPEVVEELPKMLAALGVLWDPVERCLVLPLESEALRTVVHQRYVAPGAERVRISLLKEREAFERESNSCGARPTLVINRHSQRRKRRGAATGGTRALPRISPRGRREGAERKSCRGT